MRTTAPDGQTVATLYSEHHGWLQGWLRRRLGCTHQASDLAQDTFLRLLKHDTLPRIDEPRAYLTTIAKGVLVNWYRRQSLEQAWLEALAAQPQALVPSEEERYLILDALNELDALLNALPPLVKRAFLLAQVAEYKYEDIAEELGVSLATVKRHMRQAFRHCLQHFDDIMAERS
ncbi:sigma-70 family RNA polymerase sigma factor [Pseudothauera nasutitermitis]|uniref:Sigma-70 family RNA polymerase sigma factor n=1 Tax=Pseudothauera nasutitermitis TaxID=2565930 RepID=A0A4S4B1W7_9RHOO|nr:sigma-70 family RNA polymerase sigma factor [Pseudothauera nasutitermitis]THF66175.1 sigma-70 family RNA polymerase sigma factor [Pseudothauera nasutitermitis]